MHFRRKSSSAALLTPIDHTLTAMRDTLYAVSTENLRRRGGWDEDLFADVLEQVERQTLVFQDALAAYLAHAGERKLELVEALLNVDRLSAAYTYWTRLFPPRQPDESMFVLSLLHDLSEKVGHALTLLAHE
ncbi:MAG: hypothetical protein GX573_16470 [Chloroflexi bacterium]|jgi:hypothetical protein|nr:hypothetical protein [Chloroflexota bacterium]